MARTLRAALVALALLGSGPLLADDEQRIFWDRSEVEDLPGGHLGLDLAYLGFLEDNEYRNAIADGTTLFGQHLRAALALRPAAFARLEAGALLWHLFGDTERPRLEPYLRAKLRFGGLELIFGSLEGHLTHRLIEPLFDYELHLTRPLETGVQLRYEHPRFFSDLWIDWVTLIRPHDPFQEETRIGLSTITVLLKGASGRLELPVQGTAIHLGGTIDASPLQLSTTLNGGVGLRGVLETKGFVEALRTEHHLLGYSDLSYSLERLFERGWALYLNAAVKLRHLGWIELAYFRGDRFINPMGGALFSSVSRRVNPTLEAEPLRELLLLRLTNDLELGQGLFLSLRAEPYFDLRSLKPEFSTGLYLGYRQRFPLGRVLPAPPAP
ncbi:MAG: hypothetical protein P1V51_07340 [Deltaproteobacteria bacterium]|nr:hypothetical protein [Deltaproteobacteria bacterium]